MRRRGLYTMQPSGRGPSTGEQNCLLKFALTALYQTCSCCFLS